jgi:outer membrane protein assembly factor BamB
VVRLQNTLGETLLERVARRQSTRPSNGRGIIPQHIVAHAPLTYVLLLCACLGACPQAALAGQQTNDRKPLPAPLLPVEEAWNVSLPSPPSGQSALDADRAYIPLQSGEVVALHRETGDTDWSIMLSTSWAPLVSDGVVYAAGTGEVHAVRAASGDLVWRTTLDAEPMADPASWGDRIFLLVKPAQLLALRTRDGTEVWRHAIGAMSGPPMMIASATGVFVSSGSRLSRFDVSDGHLEWERDLPGLLSRPATASDRVFVGSTDNNLYALETTTGRLAYRVRAGGDVVGAVATDQFVYVASLDNLLRALRRGSGNQIWKRNLSTRTIAPPSTFAGIVLVTGNDPTLTTFNATTGAPIASFSLAADLQGLPLVDSTLKPFRVAIVAVTRDARAIGLRPTGMMFRELPATPFQVLPGRALTREPLTPPVPQHPAPYGVQPKPHSPPSPSDSQSPTSNPQSPSPDSEATPSERHK